MPTISMFGLDIIPSALREVHANRSRFGKNIFAIASLMMATFGLAPLSPALNSRPSAKALLASKK